MSETSYVFTDEAGDPLYREVRIGDGENKRVWLERWEDGAFERGLNGHRRVPFNLPALIEANQRGRHVFVVEGPKKAERLNSLGLCATSNPEGAGKWHEEWLAYFSDKSRVIVLPDNDDAGRNHARQVAESLVGEVHTVKILELPGLPPKGDVIDWLDNGGSKDALISLSVAAETYQPNLSPIERPVRGEVSWLRSVAELAAEKTEAPPSIPFLGQEGYILAGASNMIVSYPKTGKTTLLTHLTGEWARAGSNILVLSEEPQLVWNYRVTGFSGDEWERVRIGCALGKNLDELYERAFSGEEDIVVIDTLRNVLALSDETNNSQVAKEVNPWIVGARESGKTLVLLSHSTKAGGEHGRGIAGGHALFGAVDAAIEINREPNADRRRHVTVTARLIAPEDLLYEMKEDGTLHALGKANAVAVSEVIERVSEVLKVEWMKATQLREALGDPQPSANTVKEALRQLVEAGNVVREPKEDKPGATYKWRRTVTQTSPVTAPL